LIDRLPGSLIFSDKISVGKFADLRKFLDLTHRKWSRNLAVAGQEKL
jgi:hypothetical protein